MDFIIRLVECIYSLLSVRRMTCKKTSKPTSSCKLNCFIEKLVFWNRNQNALPDVSRGSLQAHVTPMCRECSWKNSAPVIFQWNKINRSRFPPSGLHSSRFKHMCSCFFSCSVFPHLITRECCTRSLVLTDWALWNKAVWNRHKKNKEQTIHDLLAFVQL